MSESTKRASLRGPIAVAVAVAVIIFVSIYLLLPQAPLPENAPQTEFSAMRAMVHNRIVAKEPHPAGSAANLKVRNYIYEQLQALGVEAVNWNRPYGRRSDRVGMANAVLARIKGTASTGSVMVEAHYDSVPYGPGAADDCAGIVTMLECLRAVKAGPPLKNDFVCAFTDSEEFGGQGASAFLEHPWAQEVGVHLGLETRGNRGIPFIFETSPENGWLVSQMTKAGARPVASSLMYDVYDRMPFGSDFTKFKKAGMSGFNTAFIDRFAHYHTKNDNPENLSKATLQHYGANTLAFARHFGNLDLTVTKKPDAQYFNLFGTSLVHYPMSWTPALTMAALALYLAAIILGLVRRRMSAGGLAAGVGLFIIAAVALVAVTSACLAVVYGPGKIWAQYAGIPKGMFLCLPDLSALYNNDIYGYGFAFIGVGVFALLYSFFARVVRPQNLFAGALLFFAVGAVAMQALLPGGCYLFTWPLIFGSIGLLVMSLWPDSETPTLPLASVLTLIALPSLFILAPLYIAFLWTVLIILAPFLILAVALIMGLLVPQITYVTRQNRWWLPGLTAGCGILLLAIGLATSAPSSLRPMLNAVSYGYNADLGKAWWFGSDDKVDEWTAQFFAGCTAKESVPEVLWDDDTPFWKAPAPAPSLKPAQFKVVSDTVADGKRNLTIHIDSPASASWVDVVNTSDCAVFDARIFDIPIHARQKDWRCRIELFPAEGVDLVMTVDPSQPLTLRTREEVLSIATLPEFPGWPEDRTPQPNTIKHGLRRASDRIFLVNSFTVPAAPAV